MVITKELHLQTQGHTDIQDIIAKHPESVEGHAKSRIWYEKRTCRQGSSPSSVAVRPEA